MRQGNDQIKKDRIYQVSTLNHIFKIRGSRRRVLSSTESTETELEQRRKVVLVEKSNRSQFQKSRSDKGLNLGNSNGTMEMDKDAIIISEVEFSRQWRGRRTLV